MNEQNSLVCPNCSFRGTMEDFTFSRKLEANVNHNIKYASVDMSEWIAHCSCGWTSQQHKWYIQVDKEVKIHLGLDGT